MTKDQPANDTQPDAPDLKGHIRLSQAEETPLTTHAAPFGTALYLYARSDDSVDAKTIGQDYLSFRYDEDNLTFAVCDGVGQSFMGDLSARLLGDGLNEWLWQIPEKPTGEEAFAAAVTTALDALTEEGAKVVEEYKLPELPALIIAALEMQRQYGSESMFVAGRIALGGDNPWVGLCWLGDSPVAAVDVDGELVDLSPKGTTAERWNATTGVKGTVHTWIGSAKKVARVAGYTDGLGVESVPTDADLAAMMEKWLTNPPGDDASLFDVRLAPSPQTTGPADPEDLEDLKEIADKLDEVTSPVKEVKPLDVKEEESPVKEVSSPIAVEKPDTPTVGEWRPIAGEEDKPEPAAEPDEAKKPAVPQSVGEAAELLSTLSSQALTLPEGAAPSIEAQQQVHLWQQAALLGLTSAALAMLMVERLMDGEQAKD